MPMYRIDYDRDRGIIHLVIEGFWTVATVEAFGAEMIPLLARARAEGGHALVLCDARDFAIQSGDVAAAFDRAEARMKPMRDRMAMLVSSALSKMQGQRALAGTNTAFFADAAEAEQWLRDPSALPRRRA